MPNRSSDLVDQVAASVFTHPARVLDMRAAAAAADWHIPDDVLLKLATKVAPDPSIFQSEGRAPYFWPAEISSGRLDSWFTYMGVSSLKNYAKDADRGVAILPGHDHRTLPYGYSLRGQFFKAEGGDQTSARVVAHSYTVPGLLLAGANTTDVIDGMRAGLIRDVSIGFHGGEYICSICGRDMMADWDCPHWPGMYYAPVEGYDPKTGKPQKANDEKVLCTATIENAGLSEISHVYDGATPGAMVLRAQYGVAAHLIPRDVAAELEQRFRVRLPGVARQFAAVEVQRKGAAERKAGDKMPPEVTEETTNPTERTTPQVAPRADALAPIRAALDAAGIATDKTDIGERVQFLVAEVTRLRPLADDGKAFRKATVDRAVSEGVRAFGAEFKEEVERPVLELLSIAAVERQADAYARIADKGIPAGRKTDEQREPDTTTFALHPVSRPTWAYTG